LKTRALLVSLFVVCCVVLVTVVYLRVGFRLGAPAKVAIANDRSFFPAVDEVLTGAQSTIDVILYQARFYFHYPGSESNTLLLDLVEAGERGVEVRAVIEQADWNITNSEENRDVWNVLRLGDIELYFDPVGTTSHAKLVIVDDRYVIIGSTNWNHYALDINNEANVVIDSKQAARAFRTYFEELVDQSSTAYEPAFETITAEGLRQWQERNAYIVDVVDSATYDASALEGYVYFDDIAVRVAERPLDKIMAVDSLFFSVVPGESVRVVASVRTDRDEISVWAVDLERGNTLEAMAGAAERERAEIERPVSQEPGLAWAEAVRVVPVPNRVYAREVRKLLKAATDRIWIAMLDARYYTDTPRHATREKPEGEAPSETNLILSDLLSAVADGKDVRMVCDMGWGGQPPPDKIDFLRRLAAGGAEVYEDSPDVTTHAKVMIVDDSFVVLGSTNWSYYAIEENNETAVIIESPEINAHYAAYIEQIIEEGTPFVSLD
jgi:phosphatidylserine/phosphatidylglycerophosphate/cardiolipin synthase-like enzyme